MTRAQGVALVALCAVVRLILAGPAGAQSPIPPTPVVDPPPPSLSCPVSWVVPVLHLGAAPSIEIAAASPTVLGVVTLTSQGPARLDQHGSRHLVTGTLTLQPTIVDWITGLPDQTITARSSDSFFSSSCTVDIAVVLIEGLSTAWGPSIVAA